MKKPARLLYCFAAILIIPYLKIKFRVQIKQKHLIKEPFVVLANHQANYDPLFLGYALFPHRLNFVGGYELLLNPKTRLLARLFHVIPKFQYQIDLKAIKQMLQVVKNKGNLALFPTGRLSSSGQGFTTTPALVKLLKKLDVPVYFCQIKGAYLSAPKWAKYRRKGKVELDYHLLFNQEQLKTESEDKMLAILNELLDYNEYEDQIERMIPYKGKKLAENLEKILYLCPNCQSEFSLVSQEATLRCGHCDFALTIDAYGLFHQNAYFRHPLDWFEYQRKHIQQTIVEMRHYLTSQVEVKSPIGKKMLKIGKGSITLGDAYLTFDGQLHKQDTQLLIPIKDLPSLPYRAGINIEVPYQDRVYLFELEKGLAAVKWSITVEQMNR